jgi:hypothetical protein
MFDLIDELMARMERRESLFEANGWKSLSDVPPSVFMPAIFVIIDEFAQVSMQLLETRNSTALPDYTLKLESLLRLGRKFGIKFIFSSQSFLSGVRGLTETARNQIQLRLAMKNVRDEVEGTLGVDGSNRTDALMDEINSLGRFQSIFRQQEKVDGRDTWRYYHVRNLYLEYDALRKAVLDVNAALHAENASSADFAQALTSDNAYADKTVDENLVVEQQFLHFVHGAHGAVAEVENLLLNALGQVAGHAADAGVAGGEAGAANLFVQVVNTFLFFESVQECRHGAGVHGVHTRAQEAGGNAGKLAAQHADGLASLRQFPAQQLFNSAGVGDVVAHRCKVVKAVCVGHILVVVAVFRYLFHAAVQVANHRIAGHNYLTINYQLQTKYAVRGRV